MFIYRSRCAEAKLCFGSLSMMTGQRRSERSLAARAGNLSKVSLLALTAALFVVGAKPALADGGAGDGGFGGLGGGDSAFGNGGTGGNSSRASNGGGGGGAGVTGGLGANGADGGIQPLGGAGGAGGGAAADGSAGANGGGSGLGGGGGGGAGHGAFFQGSAQVQSSTRGGSGGAGGGGFDGPGPNGTPYGSGGGGGGAGGYGISVSGANTTVTVNAAVLGGNGGRGGDATGGSQPQPFYDSGNGGSGGYGAYLGAGTFLINNNTIGGGSGGAGGVGGHAAGASGSDGAGIFGTSATITNTVGATVRGGGTSGVGITGVNLTVVNAGTIAGAGAANAISFTGGANTLQLQKGYAFSGIVQGAGHDTLQLGGTQTASFDVSSFGSTGQYRGFANFNVVGGTWIVTGTGAATNASVTNGTLELDGRLTAANPILVGAGGRLSGTGAISSSTIGAGGTLAPGSLANPYGTLTVAGSLTFEAGSTFAVTVNAANQSSKLLVTGAALIKGGTLRLDAGPGTIRPGSTYGFLSAGRVSGTFSNITSNLAFLVPTLAYRGSTVDVVVKTNSGRGAPNYTTVAHTGNQQSVGAALTTAAQKTVAAPAVANDRTSGTSAAGVSGQANPVGSVSNGKGKSAPRRILTALNQLTESQARGAFDSLSGEGITSTQAIGFRTAQLFTNGMFDQMTGLGGSNAVTLTEPLPGSPVQGRTTLATQARPRELGDAAFGDVAAAGHVPQPFGRRTWHAWASGYGATDTIQGEANMGSATQTLSVYGGMMGVDYQLTEANRIGVAVGGSSSTFAVPSRATSGHSNGGQVGLYDVAHSGALYGAVSASFQYNSNATMRSTGGFGGLAAEIERGQFGSRALDTRLEFGRHFNLARGGWGAGELTPFVGVEIAALRTNGFAEKAATGSASLAMNVSGQGEASVPGEVGLRYKGGVALGAGLSLAPIVEAAFVHEFAPQRTNIAELANLSGSVFTVQGAQPADNAARVKAGGELVLGPATAVFANFDGRFSRVERLYGGSGGIKHIW